MIWEKLFYVSKVLAKYWRTFSHTVKCLIVSYLHDVHHSLTSLVLVSRHNDSLPCCQTAGLHYQCGKVSPAGAKPTNMLIWTNIFSQTHLEQMLHCWWKPNNIFCGPFNICRAHCCLGIGLGAVWTNAVRIWQLLFCPWWFLWPNKWLSLSITHFFPCL